MALSFTGAPAALPNVAHAFAQWRALAGRPPSKPNPAEENLTKAGGISEKRTGSPNNLESPLASAEAEKPGLRLPHFRGKKSWD